MRILYVAALIPIVGCIAPPEELPEVEPIEKSCLQCQFGNSPLVGGHSISWLRLDHQENEDGVRFVHFRKGNAVRDLDINRNILRFVDGAGNWRGYKDLEGSVIRVAIEGVEYDVTIEKVRNCTSVFPPPPGGPTICTEHGIPYWTEVPSGEAETYTLLWNEAAAPQCADPHSTSCRAIQEEVCPYVTTEETTGGHQYEAVAFEGDHYDPVTRNITETDTTLFNASFNIACMGSLPAKQELARRTAATSNHTYDSTIANDRQALARAWAAQYCGTEAFTKTGHQLKIRDRREWLHKANWGWNDAEPIVNSKFGYEAVWDEHGAVCLDTPRLAVSDPKIRIDPNISRKILAECGKIPRCTGQSWFPEKWKEHGQFLTATISSSANFGLRLRAPL